MEYFANLIAKKYFFFRIAVFIYQDTVFDLIVFVHMKMQKLRITNYLYLVFVFLSL